MLEQVETAGLDFSTLKVKVITDSCDLGDNRSYWEIENKLHYRKDFVFWEARSTIRTGNGPQDMDDLLSDISAQPSWPIEAFRLGYYHERSPDLTILYGPGKLTTSGSYDTGHGMPYPYDSHVPLVIRAPGVRARKIDTTVGIEQLAPTLASVLGVTPGKVPMLGGVLEGFGE